MGRAYRYAAPSAMKPGYQERRDNLLAAIWQDGKATVAYAGYQNRALSSERTADK